MYITRAIYCSIIYTVLTCATFPAFPTPRDDFPRISALCHTPPTESPALLRSTHQKIVHNTVNIYCTNVPYSAGETEWPPPSLPPAFSHRHYWPPRTQTQLPARETS